ncbi:MAG: putative transporter ATP-binding protein [Deltaproteobacteria bacterium]|nr:putative transporter ATP-binding protein [Deltaproteobacteria bacterium]
MIETELTKRYGGREVLGGARLVVRPGTVHALVGENGAGKSTLVKIVAGVVRADAGTLAIAGQAIGLARWDRIAARAAGIGIVQQHGSSAGTLSVVENAVLGVEPRRGPLLDLEATAAALAALGTRIGLPVDPRARCEALSLGAAQRAEIVAALYHGAKLLILDEPTAVLAPIEVDGLLSTLRTLATEGRTIVLVTHKLDEVRAVADEVTVLRAGKTVATFGKPLEIAGIAKAMIGAELAVAGKLEPPPPDAAEALGVTELGVGRGLANVTLSVRRGELVGVAGVDGNGQRELALAIAGLVRSNGRVRIAGVDVGRATPAHRLAAGLAHIPEDRHHGGLLDEASIADNLAIGRPEITGRWRLDRGAMRRHAEARIAELDIRPPDPEAEVRVLSGGNQQKVLVARELSRARLKAVIAAQPTRGVDLGAVARIHDVLCATASAGAGVLIISADLDELLALCHRIVVLLRGRIVGELAGEALRDVGARDALGRMMTGATAA